jgi:hypothetical protein
MEWMRWNLIFIVQNIDQQCRDIYNLYLKYFSCSLESKKGTPYVKIISIYDLVKGKAIPVAGCEGP